ncbi:MAG: hypothetical protein HKL96_05045 [Phycisphaerales bacterium]|nr:hypothetical protein [Phycisphaerales bacterium]
MTNPTDNQSFRPGDAGFARLSMLFLENSLQPHEAAELHRMLLADAKRRQQFVDLCTLRCGIDLVLNRLTRQGSTIAMPPTIVRFNEKPGPTDAGRAIKLSPPRGLLLVAAVLMLSLLINSMILWLTHYPPQSHQVAIVTTGLNTHWSTATTTGSGILAGQTLVLSNGLARLHCNGGASVTVQGPATVMMQSANAMLLTHGRVVVKAVGGHFVVHTPNAAVRDLGTWFAVAVGEPSGTEVGVYEGKVRVSSQSKGVAPPASETLRTGQAVHVVGTVIRPVWKIGWRQHFVAHIATGIRELDLVDLLCGGDGTTHCRGGGIDVRTGIAGAVPQIGYYRGNNAFHRVPALPVVNGCFIPGRGGPQQIDSVGDRFTFPTTNTSGCYILWAGDRFPAFNAPGVDPMSPILGGINYAQHGHDLVYMHPNKGITLNLRAIRRLHPGLKLTRFKTVVGNTYRQASTKAPEFAHLATDIWVIVNGKVRFSRLHFTPSNGAISVDVPLHRNDHFLTIADTAVTPDIRSHWVILGDPVLQTAPR